MPRYTTGELAKLCGVTVRTVQYYDGRGILAPSDLSEGGRRLYSEDDLHKMRMICFLRNMGLSIQSIGELFQEEDPSSVIDVMLEEQSRNLQAEIGQRQRQLDQVETLRRGLRGVDHFSMSFVGDLAYQVENKRKLQKMRIPMCIAGLLANILEWGGILWGILSRCWWPAIIGNLVGFGMELLLVQFYMKRTAYICPQCHMVFHPPFKENLLARHTVTARKLTCTYCGHHGFCVETYHRKMNTSAEEANMCK